MQILKNHTSPETAYVVNDYPYGFRLRCKIRYWLEFHPRRGFRLVSQTSNPKQGRWNKPKASTYARFGGCMVLKDNNHVTWTTLTEYSNGMEARAFLDTYAQGVPEAGLPVLRQWVAAKLAYDAARKPSDPLKQGVVEAHKAWLDEALKTVGK